MGLDCYLEKSEKSPEEVAFPSGLRLCGGMFSGHGSDGSFRGKVYTEFFSENLAMSLYSNMSPEEVSQAAEKLEKLLKEHPDQAWDTEGWRPDAPPQDLSYYGVTAQEIRDFVALFQAAAEQSLQLVASY